MIEPPDLLNISLLGISAELLLALSALLAVAVGAFSSDARNPSSLDEDEDNNFDASQRPMRGHQALAAVLVAAALLAHVPEFLADEGTRFALFNGAIVSSPLIALAKTLIALAVAVALLMTRDVADARTARFEFPVLAVLGTLGMFVMVSADDLAAMYLGLELQSLALYALAGFRRDDPQSAEAGIKYFILGAFASAMILYAASLLYGFSGALNFNDVALAAAQRDPENRFGLLAGLALLCAGFAFKLSAVPFHMWTPDVYRGAPAPSVALFAAAPKLAALFLLARILLDVFPDDAEQWRLIIAVLAALSVSVSAIAAIAQNGIRRLVAYSSIGHIGYALIGLAAATETGLAALVLHAVLWSVANLGLFAFILSMRRAGKPLDRLEHLAGFASLHRGIAVAVAILCVSLAGLPPLAGFFGKLYLFMAAVESKMMPLAVVGALFSVVAAYYYLRIVKLMFFDETAQDAPDPPTPVLKAAIGISAAFVALFCLYPAPMLALARYVAAS